MKYETEGWIARNQDPDEVIFCPGDEPPTRMPGGYWLCGFTWSYCVLPRKKFPNIKWEDEPRKVRVTFEETD